MLRFVMRKILSKKWMVLSLLIGNILLIGIASGNPMYTNAMLQRTLIRNMESYLIEKNAYPGQITLELLQGVTKESGVLRTGDALAAEFPEAYGLEAVESVRYLAVQPALGRPDMARSGTENLRVMVSALSDLPAHAEIVGGRLFSTAPAEDGVLEAVVSEQMLAKSKLVIGDVLTLDDMPDPQGNDLRVRIVGVFRNSEPDDPYWSRSPSTYSMDLFIDEGLFEEYFLGDETLQRAVSARWNVFLDYTAMRGDRAEEILALSEGYSNRFRTGSAVYTRDSEAPIEYSDSFSGLLEEYLDTSRKVVTTLWVLQTPIFILLAAFIFMVSRQRIEMEQDEIAVLKSRGAGRMQIFGMYLLESLLIVAVACAAGLPLGVYLCRVVGSANAFLEFVRRSSLPVEIGREALLYALIAAVFSVVTMVLPAVRYSRIGIVDRKRAKSRRSDSPLWQKLGVDFLMMAVALYGLYSFNGQKEILAARVQEGASLDPLLFLSCSLFMVAGGLLAVRLLPAVVWLVFRPFRRLWSPALYASFLRVLRQRGSHSFIVVFLIMTIALGMFNAQAARTINRNAEENIRYTVGADVVFQEEWPAYEVMSDYGTTIEMQYNEPDYGRFLSLEGAESVAKVYVDDFVSNGVSVHLMAIHTKDFGETAWFRDDLSDIHWYHYLNAMAQNSRAVLVSRNFQTELKMKIGDPITYRNASGDSLTGVIYGFVDYFPGYSPVVLQRAHAGGYEEVEKYLIVANLQQVQSEWGVLPYQIWIRNREDSQYLYDYADENGLVFNSFSDVSAMITGMKNDPVMQGTNGFLTVGFIVVLLLCTVGFLIYWILSIRSRSLQFGIFRAMGMSMREVLTMLVNEQIFISGLSIAAGAGIGSLTTVLYMPLIQLAYAASDNVLPLKVISQSSDTIRLFAVVGAVMLVCMTILGVLISKMKIAQALKLGED